MNFKINQKHFAAILIFAFALFASACQKQTASKPAANANAGAAAEPSVIAQTPTEAYKMIFNNVKAKQLATIKSLMSEKTIGLAQMQAQQQNKPLESVFENGLHATTFSPTMPDIRDERVKGNMGAIEVYNSQSSRWEEVPFIKENGGWKAAFGDIFAGTYESPGKGMAQMEAEASNKMGNNMVPLSPNIKGMPGAEKMRSNAAVPSNSK